MQISLSFYIFSFYLLLIFILLLLLLTVSLFAEPGNSAQTQTVKEGFMFKRGIKEVPAGEMVREWGSHTRLRFQVRSRRRELVLQGRSEYTSHVAPEARGAGFPKHMRQFLAKEFGKGPLGMSTLKCLQSLPEPFQ